MHDQLASLRHEVSNGLLETVRAMLATYHEFSKELPPMDAKGFAAYHAACKAALSHLELLLKLSDCTDESVATEVEKQSHDLLDEARAALRLLEEETL